MAGRLNWAMEKMGWRVPAEEEMMEAEEEMQEYPFAESRQTAEAYSFEPTPSVSSVPQEDARQRISTIHPKSYADVMAVGEAFRDNVPVIMNLTGMDDAEARRVVDFAAGLTFGLRGAIERVTTRVFLLSPADTHVSRDLGARM